MPTPYLALYRTWRPKRFSDVVGQEHITSVLKSEVLHGTVSHAYLFCGSRGTGKTTCAKILAKAVSCENTADGDPCGVCPSCIAAENSFDIYEIDAASHNGVDNIRELRDNVVYPPSELKRRVYIIDEVHMLSAGAFNALLKTLEEPPEHAMFILATTELSKIPATILSRCKRFDFHRITPEVICERLKMISEKENIKITAGALMLISRLASGAMRDALSMLELFLQSETETDEEQAAARLGVVGKAVVIRLIAAISKSDTAQALDIISEAYDNSKDMDALCSELSETIRDLLMIKYTSAPEKFIEATEAVITQLKECAKGFTAERLIYCAEITEDVQNKLSRAIFGRRALVETAVIRLCEPVLSPIPEALLSRISALEDTVSRLASGVVCAPANQTNPSVSANSDEDFPSPSSESAYHENQQELFGEEQKMKDESSEKPKAKRTKPPAAEIKLPGDILGKPSEGENKERNEGKPFAAFSELLEDIKEKNIIVYSLLVDAKAFLKEDTVEIYCSGDAAVGMLSSDSNIRFLEGCASKLLGYEAKVKLFHKKKESSEHLDLKGLME